MRPGARLYCRAIGAPPTRAFSASRAPRSRATIIAAAIAGAGLTLGAGVATGSSNGGGIGVDPAPKVTDVVCTERCLDLRQVAVSGKLELRGKHLEEISEVKFPAKHGKTSVEPQDVTSSEVVVKVPDGAKTGKPSLVDDVGRTAVAPVEVEVEPKDAVEDVGKFSVSRAKASSNKTYFDGKNASSLSYLFKADGPADIRVDVVSQDTGDTVASIVQRHETPFATHTATWDGLVEGGRIAPDGDYRFSVSALSGGAGAGAKFSYYDHIFPLRGKHTYGQGLGAGRGHEGQDVFAKCGTKIVAARGGRVQAVDYQSAAGYYVVIDGAKEGNDYFYAHMEKRGRPKVGSRIHTGQLIGFESDTGDAQGCHMHFEYWSAPGWYEGGHVLNPTKPLKKWDAYS
jgi:murein DD-endopeptidase MepM/ murein hydrolase activator NlpD